MSGQIKAVRGDNTYPTITIYNGQGQISELRTFSKWPHTTGDTGPDENTANSSTVIVDSTTWNYDSQSSTKTGRLLSKHDAAGKGPSYLYTAAGRFWKVSVVRSTV